MINQNFTHDPDAYLQSLEKMFLAWVAQDAPDSTTKEAEDVVCSYKELKDYLQTFKPQTNEKTSSNCDCRSLDELRSDGPVQRSTTKERAAGH
jgi:hypothetical protein